MQNGRITYKLPFWLSWNVLLKEDAFPFMSKPQFWFGTFLMLLGAHSAVISWILPSETNSSIIDRILYKVLPFIHHEDRSHPSIIFGLMAWSLPLLVVSALRVEKAAAQAVSLQGKLCSLLCGLTLLSYLCSVLTAIVCSLLGYFTVLSKYFGCAMAIHGLSFVVDYLMLKRSDLDAVREMFEFCDHSLTSNSTQQTFSQLSNFQKVLRALFDTLRKTRNAHNSRIEWYCISKIQQLWKKTQHQGWTKALFFQEFVHTVKTPSESNDILFLMIAKSAPHLLRELLPELSLNAHKRACGKIIKLMGWKSETRQVLCNLENEEFMERLIQLASESDCPPPHKVVEQLRAVIKEDRYRFCLHHYSSDRSRSVEKAMGLLGSRIHLPPPPPSKDQGDVSPSSLKTRRATSVDESWIVM